MIKNLLFLSLAFLISSQTHAADLIVVNGQLHGAKNVDVGGNLYDVEFVDGTCIELFDGCDEFTEFTFPTRATAAMASQALLDQVFLDNPTGDFDSDPKLTNGCSELICSVSLPYRAFGVTPNVAIARSTASNSSIETNDMVFPHGFVNQSVDLSGNPSTVYAVWEAAPKPVTIDIKPGSDPNSVNPGSQGVIPVAVLGSIDFDATQVDPTTVTFGPDGASLAHNGHVEDVNGDGFTDAVFHFSTQETGITCGDIEATLIGETFGGRSLTGTDSVKTVGCPRIPVPECDIQLNQAAYIEGDIVTADVFRFANLTGAPVATEINIWLSIPGIPPISIVNVGADGSVEFPAGMDVDLGPIPLFPVTAALPRGNYEFTCHLLNPATGELLAEDRNFFEIQTANTYAIGQTGPAGGIVFHVTDGGLHGLEAAPVDQGTAEWGCVGTDITGADGTAVGTGAQNTADILASCATPGIAARLADSYTLNGFDDWFLPSTIELNELYLNQDVVGGFASVHYWSSSEFNDGRAYAQLWTLNFRIGLFKDFTHGVRAVRAF